jgi:Mn-dependent DtxR family transcriptional regulator
LGDTEKLIREYLQKRGKSCVKDIAKGVNVSPATASKYLLALLRQKKVKQQIKLPYRYYEVVKEMNL